jgi:hypothetical protein
MQGRVCKGEFCVKLWQEITICYSRELPILAKYLLLLSKRTVSFAKSLVDILCRVDGELWSISKWVIVRAAMLRCWLQTLRATGSTMPKGPFYKDLFEKLYTFPIKFSMRNLSIQYKADSRENIW